MYATRGIGATLFLAVTAFLAVPAASAQTERWLDPDSSVRRIVTCEPASTSLPGDDVAVVTFYTGGKTAKGCEDVRVFADSDPPRPVPHRLIMQGPGDRVRIAFATPKGVRRYHVYYGNPQPGPPPKELEIRRGLLYEVRTGDAANADRVAQIDRAFSRAPPQGAAFVDNIFFGFNPFGETQGFISRFTGYLNITKPGAYRVATTSDDCSFLLIDDKLVVQWGGIHRAVPDARHNAPVDLDAGLHKLTYWHAQGGDASVAEAAWLPPGETRYVVIPRTAFAPIAIAEPAEIQFRGQRISPDFYAATIGESFLNNAYLVRMEFSNTSFPAPNPQIAYRWDFGDGQTSARINPTHVYLRQGAYDVRLTVTWGPQKETVVNRVVVERNWWRQASGEIEPLPLYARDVAAYDLKRLDAASLSNAVDLFDRVGRADERLRALEVLVFDASAVAESQMVERAAQLAEFYRAAARHADAVRAHQRAESKAASVAAKAEMAIAAARVILDDLDKPADAEREYRRVLKDYAEAPPIVLRDAHIGLGDVASRRGAASAAMEAYRLAESIPVGGLADRNPTLRVSSLARYVEEYTRTADYQAALDYLRTWYREFPSQRVTGQAPLFEARLWFARGDWNQAARVADRLVAVNRESPFAADAIFVAVEANLKLGRDLDARTLLAQIVDDYPESGRRKEASELLRKLGGPPPQRTPD